MIKNQQQDSSIKKQQRKDETSTQPQKPSGKKPRRFQADLAGALMFSSCMGCIVGLAYLNKLDPITLTALLTMAGVIVGIQLPWLRPQSPPSA